MPMKPCQVTLPRQTNAWMIGLARRQFARIHQGVRYDFEVDTSLATPLECAERIKARFGL